MKSDPLTPALIGARVARLRDEAQHDKPAAAAGADMLRVEVLRSIAEGAANPVEMAREALVTIDEDLGGD